MPAGSFDPWMDAAPPTRKTSEADLNTWNQQLRASEVYQQFMRRNGLPTNGRVKLSRSQQAALERDLAAAGVKIPSGMHIDQGGNANQKNRTGRNVAIGAAATGAALTGFGLAGMGPLSGLGGASAAGAEGGMLASHSLPVASLMGGPAAIASQGVSAGVGTAAGVGASGAAATGAAAAKGASMGTRTRDSLLNYGLPAIGDFFTSMFKSGQDREENARNRQFLQDQQGRELGYNRERDIRDVALEESKLDPWRDTMSQVGHAATLDRVANANYTPVTLSRGSGGSGIQRSGGTTYQKSPEVIQAARTAAALILSGGGRAPSMTDPANYGRSGATDLRGGPRLAPAGGGPPVSTTMPVGGGPHLQSDSGAGGVLGIDPWQLAELERKRRAGELQTTRI